MSRVLITGSSGFVGSHLAEALSRRGGELRCLVRRTSAVDHLRELGAELVLADLAQPEDLTAVVRDVDVVYHLAGKTSALRKSELMRVNGAGTAHLAGACASLSRPPVFIFVSSVAAAGPSPKDRLRTETDAEAPVSNYGRSKRAGEIAVESLADKLPATVIRPGIIFGPRDGELLPVFSTIRRFRCHPIPGFRSPRLSLIHVEDLVEMLLLAAERGSRVAARKVDSADPGSGYYFACGPEFPTYAELGRMIAGALNRRILPIPVPYPLPWLIAGGNQLLGRIRGRSDPFNVDKIREARADSWACSPEAARRDLGFAARKPLAQRLDETARWYVQQGWL